MQQSAERTKQLLATEEKLLKKIMAADTLNDYQTSTNGFWYYFEEEVSGTEPTLRTDDEALITYTIMDPRGDTIYTQKEIGTLPVKVDKIKLFPGLRNALKLMRQGEKATFLFPSTQAYGYKGDAKKIGRNQPLRTSLHILQLIRRNDSTTRF